ncbi:RluA family pseudouridine synthase [Marinilabilia salmonicolor]|jgi:23S rRNA pseudouridine1911/1915/1917 synthase|uniref:Pseudouridine synthase n=1 Tax=Marinilabilia salmonicolor TaxID=989 RepID=A0A2T0XA70_9BACT|nr:RluA family pseudouridine synthase [Marinilabilia salmonicolor]PRY95829.1 ribosomal large subunit pseudouridine synthase D [Marinilabilia salmonicolor]RCW36604.1 ribosomal large subunit pseudouridine synthase D [Marinilabilia salmonicolor]
MNENNREFDETDDLEELIENKEETDSGKELYEHYRFVADAGQNLLRVDKFLVNRIENASRNKIQDAAAAGSVLANGNPVKANYKVKPGDTITIEMSWPPREIEILPEDIPLNIVYEDDALIVVNKQPGMVVHPGFGNYTGTLVNALAWHLKDHPWFQSNDPRPGLVHRIDKDTSGLLVIAKTEEAKTNLARQFFYKTTERTYQAIAWGSMKEDEGTITGNIGRSIRDRKQMTVFEDESMGKPAVTHYKVLERLGYVTLVQCNLETGRTHQIRVHLKYIGHTLFNDERYGGNQILKGTTFTKYKQFVKNCFTLLPRQALHAKTLGFEHPVTGEFMRFDSDLPDDMVQTIDKWRNYIAGREEE